MARYIDEELLLQKLSRMIDYCEKNKDKTFNALNVLFQVGDAIMDCPTVDVVPRAEIEKLHEVIFKKEDLMQKIAEERNKYADELEVVKDINEHLKAEVAREIFEEIEKQSIYHFAMRTYSISELKLAKLKKKYTEDK